jgi:hypothetical protein
VSVGVAQPASRQPASTAEALIEMRVRGTGCRVAQSDT